MTVARPRSRPVDPARRAAFDTLRAVHATDAYANLTLSRILGERALSARDAAMATELVAGTCRWQGSYDRILAAAAGRGTSTFQPAVLDVLRLGVHQLLGMRTPAHAAVAATVDLAARAVGPRVTGLTNAVLRRVAERERDDWLDTVSAGLPPQEALGVRTGHSDWIVAAYADVLPEDELVAALEADNLSPTPTLAVRPGLAHRDELVAAGAIPTRYSPFGATLAGNPGDLAAVRAGRAGVQDEGSQLVSWAVTRPDAPPGWWLDLCAGPGGKTALLAGLAAADSSRVLAVEVAPHRADLVRAAVRGHPPGRTAVVVADGARPAWRTGTCVRVLADVPCTGLGALRRRPEARWRRDPDDAEALHSLQLALARTALGAAAPGGIVGYVTCSPHRRETIEVVQDLLGERGDAQLLDARTLLPELTDDAFVPLPGYTGAVVQLWPHRHGTDAMFAAYVRKGG